MNESVDSDEIVEITCEKCSVGLSPRYFCTDCVCLMCSSCKTNHDLFLETHTFEEGKNVPFDLYRMKCSKHLPAVTKFYCLRCDVFACVSCVNFEHSSCANMLKSVNSLSKGLNESLEFTNVCKRINDAEGKIEMIGVNNITNWSDIDDNKDKSIKEIEALRDEIILKVRELSDELCNTLEFEASTFRAKILDVEMQQTSLQEEVKALKHSMERTKMSKENCLLFKILKLRDIDKIESSVISFERDCGTFGAFRHIFEPSEDVGKIRSILTGMTSFGSLKASEAHESVRQKLRDTFRLLSFRK